MRIVRRVAGTMSIAKYFLGSLLALPMFGPVSVQAEPVGDETFEGSLTCSAPAGAAEDGRLSCKAFINPGLPEIDLALVLRDDGARGARVLDRIELRRGGNAAPFQVLKGIALRVPAGMEKGGVEMVDVNFDGYFDLRMRRADADGGALYQNWVWSKEQGAFIDIPELDAIVSPEFNAEDQEIASRWKRGASERGSDTYSYDGQIPLLVHREIDQLSAGGACRRIFYDRIDDELKKTGSGTCDNE